ncbi:HyaD/HybD family hydrogenase maturation endopeptidase [uncultured Veillonella sp.]|uniref:HyaD/HybD family hydrogenase maturation endopeptidase n=1 Tax=uncultured Veillonella sp. TaxID=159268 RepID=UPI0025939E98|nr:HyaD/HybD family hydrogenase maturation endopeptidase [uncultured Veillonella sp.]
MATENSITLLGVGNILLSDEGVGVHVVNEMRQDYTFTPEINIVDGGTMGMELLSYMRGMKKLLLVDAVQGGESPGTVYEFLHQETETYFAEHISVHEVGMQDILRIRALQEDPLDDAVVIGVEPMSLDIGLEPTPLVQQAMPDMKQRIIAVLTNWGVEVKKKDD